MPRASKSASPLKTRSSIERWGKAPAHIDTSAVRHTEIVYRSAQEIRQELINRVRVRSHGIDD
jgi:hypothetical protein